MRGAKLPPANMNLSQLISESEIEKLVPQGFKREALDKLRQMEIGELQRSGLIKVPENDYETLRKARVQISQATALKKKQSLHACAKTKALQKAAGFCHLKRRSSNMNYRKVDVTLAAAVDEIENAEELLLAVCIYTAKTRDETATIFLNGIGVRVYSTNQEIFTATVSPHTVKELSQQPWVRYVKLSQKLNLRN